MPPHKQISKEAILSSALTMTREKGFDAITARALAASIGCSTQPIYQSFADMKELEKELAALALRKMLEYIRQQAESGMPRDLAVAFGYVSFAREERFLFQLIARNGGFRTPTGSDNFPLLDPKLVIFANGLVFLSAFQAVNFSPEQTKAILTEAYQDFKIQTPKVEDQP